MPKLYSLILMKWIYFLIALVYLISPYDILPDFLGLPGRIDDIAVLIYVYWKYFRVPPTKSKKDYVEAEFSKVESVKEKDPYQILELKPGASRQEIELQYKNLMTKYHPDKVNHLGAELQKVAHEKTLEIQAAYKKLTDE